MAAPTAGWLLYPPKGEAQQVAQRLMCWSGGDPRIAVGTAGGTHFVIPTEVCEGTPLALNPDAPAGEQIVCSGANPDGWVVVANYTNAQVTGIDPNTCSQVPAPTGLATGTITATSIELTWDAPEGATGYIVRYRPDGSTGEWTTVETTTPSATVTGLTASTAYDFTVQAVVGGYESAQATITASTTA